MGTNMNSSATARVVISYSKFDWEAANRLRSSLEAAGVPCWIAPRDVPKGSDWPGAIADAIDACAAMVLVFSHNADNSEEIKKELVLASNARKLVIPARLEDLAPKNSSFRYELSIRQWVDMFTDWQAGIGEIVGRVQYDPPPAQVPSQAPTSDSVTIPTSATLPKKEARRHRYLVPLVAAILIAVCGIGYVAVTGSNPAVLPADAEAKPDRSQVAAAPAVVVPPAPVIVMNATITNDGKPGNIRSGPNPTAPLVKSLPSGTELRVVEDRHAGDSGGWARIDQPESGWIAKSAVRTKPPAKGFTTNAVIFSDISDAITLRRGAGDGNSAVGTLANGTPIRIIDDSGSWAKIDLPREGWIIKWAYRHELRP